MKVRFTDKDLKEIASHVKKISLVKGHTLALHILHGSMLIHRGNRGLLKVLEYLSGVPMLPYTNTSTKVHLKYGWRETLVCLREHHQTFKSFYKA